MSPFKSRVFYFILEQKRKLETSQEHGSSTSWLWGQSRPSKRCWGWLSVTERGPLRVSGEMGTSVLQRHESQFHRPPKWAEKRIIPEKSSIQEHLAFSLVRPWTENPGKSTWASALQNHQLINLCCCTCSNLLCCNRKLCGLKCVIGMFLMIRKENVYALVKWTL